MISKDKLMWGKPCKRFNHQKEDGTNLRHAKTNRCMACEKSHETFKDQDELYEMLTIFVPKKTKEEKAAGAVAASMRWNARNKDKVKEYAAKYAKKDSRKAAGVARYAALSPEEKRILVEKAKERREAKRALEEKDPTAATPGCKLSLQEKKDRHNARMRALYASMTTEQKDALYERAKERKALKQLKDKDETNSTT